MPRIEVERILDAPPETVFARYTDHAAWTDWAGVGRVTLAREGTPAPNGVGAVRAFESALGLQERVVSFDPPRHMTYKVVRGGFPLKDHLGEVAFEPHPRGTRLVWSASFGSRVPFTEGLLARFVERMFGKLLGRFEKHGMRDGGT
jgi:uncharacterized protein YndB with AHSA1/START domain